MTRRDVGWALDVFVMAGVIVLGIVALCFAGAATAMLWGYEQVSGVVATMTILVVLATCIRRLARLMRRGAS